MPKPLSVPVEAISGKSSATDGEQGRQKGRRKHIKQQLGGTKDDVTMVCMSSGAEGNRQGRQQELGREAAQRRPQDALRTLSASAGSQRRSLHVLDDQARGARVQETEGAISVPARNWRRARAKGHGLGPPGIAAFTGLLQALSERGSTVGAANAAGVAHLKQTWDDLEPERAFPHCKLARVYDPALSRLELVIKRGTTSRAHLCTRTNRSESSSRSSSKRSFGKGTVSSDRTELKNSEFCCSITSRFTNQTPIATG